ncbi:polysaccharide biosynthesis/export family protein [Echinicola shivajiensis]|uniref:polysaccharide biosynthesis/export family protein n=1 Tax=Echinicola shivajiensis TaxID=1035916 RepID=UPI001BFC3EF8|nr:polysaccharide biosynthesis/export family protein [Echinicola shivajiensis]
MKPIKILVLITLFSICVFSCISNKKVIYLQDEGKEEFVSRQGEQVVHKVEDYYLLYNDVVDISIRTTSPEINMIFSDPNALTTSRMASGGLMSGGDVFFLQGYSIDDNGMVELPLIGEISLVGLTTKEAKLLIEEKLREYIVANEFFVRVRLGGIRYSALGEFLRPGKYTLLQNRVTIFEAIANAGDLTIYANRDQVHLIRQYPEGSKNHTINLNNKDIMESEFYFLKPNDLIYVEPMKVRELGTGATLIQTFQLLVSLVTVGLLVYTATN